MGFQKRSILIASLIFPIILYLTYRGGRQISWRLDQETNLFSKGQIAMNQGDCKTAVEIFNVFLNKDPNHLSTLEFKQDCELQLERWSDAIESGLKILQIEPSLDRKKKLALIYLRSGNPQKGVELLNLKSVDQLNQIIQVIPEK